MKKPKKRNPTDATLRNVRAHRSAVEDLADAVQALKLRLTAVESRVSALEAGVIIVTPKVRRG